MSGKAVKSVRERMGGRRRKKKGWRMEESNGGRRIERVKVLVSERDSERER